MKKILLIVSCIAISLSCLFMGGCHGSKKTASFVVPEEFDTSKKYEITFWAKNDTNIYQTEVYKKAIEDFQALYPNVTVNLRLYTDYGKIYNDVITNIATGTTPNVCVTYPDHIATYKTGENVVVPLNELFDNPRYGLGGSDLLFDGPEKNEFIPEFLMEGVLDNVHYALPFMRSTEACYVNEDMVNALGYELPDVLTWDYIWEVSEAATAKDADGNFIVNGQKVLLPFIYKSTDNMMISMLKQKDAGYSDSKGNIKIFNDTTSSILLEIAGHVKSGAFSTFKISGYPANFLNAGQCIFAIDSTAGATWMGSKAPNIDIAEDRLIDFNIKVLPIPQYDVNNKKMISQGPSLCLFNKDDPQEVLASWLFAQYLMTNEVQVGYSKTEGYLPVTLNALACDEYQEYIALEGTDDKEHYQVKIDATRLLMENTQNTFTTPVFNGSTSLRDAAGHLIEDVAKSTRRKQTVNAKYISDLFDDVTSLYRLDQISSQQGGGAKADLGPLPKTSIWLLSILGVVWLLIIAYFVVTKAKSKVNK